MDAPIPHDEIDRPVIVSMPESGVAATSLLLASPHSGRAYPASFLDASRLDVRALRQNEDSFVDELFADAPRLGVPLLAATFPRAFCDANREQWELDPDMFSEPLPAWCNTRTARIAAGHGTIPRMVGSGERIHRRKLRFDEARLRIGSCWEPYHRTLQGLIERIRERDGRCLLIDCHSMPTERGGDPADFVLGDGHGTSCAPAITAFVETFLAAEGGRVRRNDPYAGGFVTRHYGRPETGVHVLQLEIARGLYLEEATRTQRTGFAALRTLLGGMVASLVAVPDLVPHPD